MRRDLSSAGHFHNWLAVSSRGLIGWKTLRGETQNGKNRNMERVGEGDRNRRKSVRQNRKIRVIHKVKEMISGVC